MVLQETGKPSLGHDKGSMILNDSIGLVHSLVTKVPFGKHDSQPTRNMLLLDLPTSQRKSNNKHLHVLATGL